MSNFFDHFTIVSNIVKHISWNDINSFKKLNSLCAEVCEHEEARRCFGILCGYLTLQKSTSKSAKRQKLESNNFTQLLQANLQCKKPKVIFLFSNYKHKLQLEDILLNQCDSNSIICQIYSKHGNIGSASSYNSSNIQFNYSFSSKKPGLSWLCFPNEIEAEILKPESEINPNTKLVIILNDSCSKKSYLTGVFSDEEDGIAPDLVIHSGGLVNSIEVFDHEKRCFERLTNISIAIAGDNFHVDKCVLHAEHRDADVLEKEFSSLKARSDKLLSTATVKYQCILVFSCYIRRQIKLESPSITEYELFARYFPGIPITGVLCEGEIFHINKGVVKLLKSLNDSDLDGSTSIFLILSWTQ